MVIIMDEYIRDQVIYKHRLDQLRIKLLADAWSSANTQRLTAHDGERPTIANDNMIRCVVHVAADRSHWS